jgi:GR25 family glycosyltransferase involved in LPS biosynthesis
LESRGDRRTHFEENIRGHDFFSGVSRFNAIGHAKTGVGCSLSHAEALKQLQREFPDAAQYLVMEDDFAFLPGSTAAFEAFQTAFAAIRDVPGWDVVTLTPYTPFGMTCTDEGMDGVTAHAFHRINNCQTTSAYIVTAAYAPMLISIWEASAAELLSGEPYRTSAADQKWKALQEAGVFLYFEQFFGRQLDGWSDNELYRVTYTNVFTNVYRR